MSSTINSKRIAKNTLYLYLRMLLVMVVSLFTVRVVLNALGPEDYGIFNVVGGVVAMFAFLTSTLTSASLRFFSYNIGINNNEKLSQYFTMSFWCYAFIALIIIALAETLGLWFVTHKLTIPSERMDAAIFVYHLSIFSFVINVLAIPYNSIVIAHERMNMYAIVGIIECLLKLTVAYIIYISPYDKLKSYAILMFLTTTLVQTYFVAYGIKHFIECRIKKFWRTSIFREIASFSGWTLFGTLSGVCREQGINILLNIFFNPVVNAARAIAYQISSSLNQFVLSFYKAVQPQITKSYGAGDMNGMHSLVYRSSRFCFYLIILISIPVLLETEFILKIWLSNIPDYTVLFTRLVILTAIVDSISYPLQTSISATGKVKYFQIVTGGLLILNLPIAWLFLKMGFRPEVTMYIAMSISCLAQFIRILFAHYYTQLSIAVYMKSVIIPIILVAVTSIIIPIVLESIMSEGWLKFTIVLSTSLISTLTCIWFIGISAYERESLSRMIINKIKIVHNEDY